MVSNFGIYSVCLLIAFYNYSSGVHSYNNTLTVLRLKLVGRISVTADGPQRARLPIRPTATLQSCLWLPSLPGFRLRFFIAM